MNDSFSGEEMMRRNELWCGRLQPLSGGAFNERAEIAALVRCAAEPFAGISGEQCSRLVLACALFNDAVLVTDDMVDYVSGHGQATSAEMLPRLLPLLIEAQLIYAELFDARAPFWVHFRRYFADYLLALERESAARSKRVAASVTTEVDCIEIARAKNGLVRIIAAACCNLAQNYALLDELAEALTLYFIGMQMVDDLRDWREDSSNGLPSLLLCRAAARSSLPLTADELGVAIYRDGHADMILATAETWLGEAETKSRICGGISLASLIGERRGRTGELRSTMLREMKALALGHVGRG